MAKSRNPAQPSKQRTRGASRYKRSETARLLRAAADAGLPVRSIEADPVTGALRILVGELMLCAIASGLIHFTRATPAPTSATIFPASRNA